MGTEAVTRFRVGDKVRVCEDAPQRHHRTPWYVKSRQGRIAALCGAFKNPEELAYGGAGLPERPLYRVEFEQRRIWRDYAGNPSDRIYVDLYEHWLEPA